MSVWKQPIESVKEWKMIKNSESVKEWKISKIVKEWKSESDIRVRLKLQNVWFEKVWDSLKWSDMVWDSLESRV